MALSGSFSNTICDGHYGVRVDWSATQSVANNNSTITAKVYMIGNWALEIAARTHTITINGVSQKITSSAISKGDGSWSVLLGTVTQTVAHSADGTKSVSMAVTASFQATIRSTYYESISASTTATLNTIARASQPTLSASSVAFGSNITVYTNRASTSFTHLLHCSINGGTEATLSTNVTDSYVWTVPETLMHDIPNATSATITLKLYTINGNTLIGTKTVSFTATVPASVKPNISGIGCADLLGYLETYGAFVQNKSRLKVTVLAEGNYSSTIKSYKIVVNDVTYASNGCETETLKTAGTNTVTVTVTDSRNRTATETKSIEVLGYIQPIISAFSAVRCLEDGTENEDGAYMKVDVIAAITALNNLNIKTFKLNYKLQSEEVYDTSKTWSDAYTIDDSVIIAADVDNSYDVQMVAQDAFAEVVYNIVLGTAFTLMDFNKSGKGIAFGKVSEKDAFECELPAIFNSCKTEAGADLDELALDIATIKAHLGL